MAHRRPSNRSRGTSARRSGSATTGSRSRRPRSGASQVATSADRFAALGTAGRPADSEKSFAELGVPDALVPTLSDAGMVAPFPIQSATLPDTLAGRDVLGRGRTGSGKTLAFVLPIVARLAKPDGRSGRARQGRRPRALVLAPTRELVAQIDETLRPFARAVGLHSVTVFGGVSQKRQEEAFRRGVDVVVACPGRLEDLIQQGHASLDDIEITVLDEADHMADLGFLPGVKRLLDRTPPDGQRLLFSATLDGGIDVVVRRYLSDPIVHSVDSESSPVEQMTHHVLRVNGDERVAIVADLAAAPGRTMVFTRTKYRAKALARQLVKLVVPAVEMHGNLTQNARLRNLAAFSDGRAAAMVATDIAARGIHVDDVALVVHADPPVEHKAYLHRSGRTARAGSSGTVITIATPEQRGEVESLMRKAGVSPEVADVRVGDELLSALAPGVRVRLSHEELADALPSAPAPQGRSRSDGQRSHPKSQTPKGSRGGQGSKGSRKKSSGQRSGGSPSGGRAAAPPRSRRRPSRSGR